MSSRHSSDASERTPSPASQFDEIAVLYDGLMSGVPYRQWVEYLDLLLKEYKFTPSTVLDLCCGTGRVSRLLAEKGMQVTGVDISAEMIERAREVTAEEGLYVDYHVQDAAKLRLGKKFDLVVSLFDSLNYILDASALQQAFYRVYEHLNPGGLLIFDMNTELAFTAGLFNQSNLGREDAPVYYNWRSSYDSSTRICRVHMDFRYLDEGGYREVEVIHYQRAYDVSEIRGMLQSADLQVLCVYDAYSLKKSHKNSDRVFYVARK